jgi:hypothetical protein
MHELTTHLGYQVGTGAPIVVPIVNAVASGQSQRAGKTTLFEAMISRAPTKLAAIAFVTKRGEGCFTGARQLRPYFRDRADWQFVSSLIDATLQEKNKYLRQWIIKICETTRTLADVQAKVREKLKTARGKDEGAYVQIDAYLEMIVPEIARAKLADGIMLAPGLNVMDVSGYTLPMQMLFVRSAIDWVNEKLTDTVVIVPEAWEMIPQGTRTPVSQGAVTLVRKGSALHNFIWADSQDLRGVDKVIVGQCPLFLIGVQREFNEVERAIKNIPAGVSRPRAADVMLLKRGQFFVCWEHNLHKVFVQPKWMSGYDARRIAIADEAPPSRMDRDKRIQPHEGGNPGAANAASGHTTKPVPAEPLVPRMPAPLVTPVQAVEPRTLIPPADPFQEFHDQAMRAAGRNTDRMILGEQKEDDEMSKEDADRIEKNLAKTTTLLERVATAVAGSPLPAVLGEALSSGPAPTDVDALYQTIKQRLLADGALGGATYTITPPEKLRKDFQREETARIVEAVNQLKPLAKQTLKLIEALDEQYLSQSVIATRLGRSNSGNAAATLKAAIESIVSEGFVQMTNGKGASKALRSKIAADLESYKATADEIEAVYQNVLNIIATSTAE